MKQLAEFFQDKRIRNLLDVGTGTGDFIKVLKDVFPKSQITGIDPDPGSLKEASEKYPGVKLLKMGAENLEFKDNSFELASISMALHHLTDVQGSLKEMQRVVKRGGWVIINELFSDQLNPAQEVHKIYHHFRSATHRILGISHNETFKRSEIVEMIKNSGISIQVQFDNHNEDKLVAGSEVLNERIQKMKEMLETVKDFPEYDSLKPSIDLFREQYLKYGFQPASRVVLVGKVI